MKLIRNSIVSMITASIVFGLGGLVSTTLHAKETTAEKIQNETDDAARKTKKVYRKAKKQVRDATGKSSIHEDFKDGARNLDDEATDALKKAKRKID